MLKTLDVLIGLTVIVLALSMAVTIVTQAVTAIFNTRGRHLRRGLSDLLQQLSPDLGASSSKEIATSILTHPLVSGSSILFTGKARLGNVIHRDEFTKLLMALGGGHSPLEEPARRALQTALTANGVSNPDEVLGHIRELALELEQQSPDVSHVIRQNQAILHVARSELVAKINNWFDQTMDRTSQRFTASTRAVTFAGAFLVAFGLQVDTTTLVNRLAADDELRAQLVADARQLYDTAAAGTTGATGTPEEQMSRRYRAVLSTTGIMTLPSVETWRGGFNTVSVFGLLLTAFLLSLGAPFWYKTLGRLLQLRSVLAAKEDGHRRDRQMSDSAAAATSGSPPGRTQAALIGERGDLTAVG